MYAVFEDGSRQYRVAEGDVVIVDFREADVGQTVEFPRVLMLGDGAEADFGTPTVAGAKIVAEVLGHPTKKTVSQKFRRRKNYKRLVGHRQTYTRVRVTEVSRG